MKNPLRRTLSFFLALVLAFSPLTAAAEGRLDDTEEPEIIEQITEELPEESEEPEDPAEEPNEEPEPIEESLPTEPEEPAESVPAESEPEESEEPVEDSEDIPDVVALADIVASGTCGANLKWTVDSSFLLTISGKGDMTDYASVYDSPWYRMYDDIFYLKIEDGVTSLGDYAFNHLQIYSISIPNSVKRIGKCCFEMGVCNSLKLGTGIESIEQNAFFSCMYLNSVTFPKSVKSLGEKAFGMCDSLSTITFQGDAPSIGNNCFYWDQATVYYPRDNETWTEAKRQNYGGSLNWKPTGAASSYDIEFFTKWDATTKTAYFGPDNKISYKTGSSTKSSFLSNPTALLNKYVRIEYQKVSGSNTKQLINLTEVSSRVGVVTKVTDKSLSVNGVTYTYTDYADPPVLAVGDPVLYHLDDGKIGGIEILIEERKRVSLAFSEEGTTKSVTLIPVDMTTSASGIVRQVSYVASTATHSFLREAARSTAPTKHYVNEMGMICAAGYMNRLEVHFLTKWEKIPNSDQYRATCDEDVLKDQKDSTGKTLINTILGRSSHEPVCFDTSATSSKNFPAVAAEHIGEYMLLITEWNLDSSGNPIVYNGNSVTSNTGSFEESDENGITVYNRLTQTNYFAYADDFEPKEYTKGTILMYHLYGDLVVGTEALTAYTAIVKNTGINPGQTIRLRQNADDNTSYLLTLAESVQENDCNKDTAWFLKLAHADTDKGLERRTRFYLSGIGLLCRAEIDGFSDILDAWSFRNNYDGFHYDPASESKGKGNSVYRIHEAAYRRVFGDAYVEAARASDADVFSSMMSEWGGNCEGMAVMASLLYTGDLDLSSFTMVKTVNDFWSDHTTYYKNDGYNGKKDNTYIYTTSEHPIAQMIENYQVLEAGSERYPYMNCTFDLLDDHFWIAEDETDQTLRLRTPEEEGTYIRDVLNIIQNSTDILLISLQYSGGAHAVVVRQDILPKEIEGNGYRIFVYDPNHPAFSDLLLENGEYTPALFYRGNEDHMYIDLFPQENKWRWNGGNMSGDEEKYCGTNANGEVLYKRAASGGNIPEFFVLCRVSGIFPVQFNGTESWLPRYEGTTGFRLTRKTWLSVWGGKNRSAFNSMEYAGVADDDTDLLSEDGVIYFEREGTEFDIEYAGGEDFSVLCSDKVFNFACPGEARIHLSTTDGKIEIQSLEDNEVIVQITSVYSNSEYTSLVADGTMKAGDKAVLSLKDDTASAEYDGEGQLKLSTDNNEDTKSRDLVTLTESNGELTFDDLRTEEKDVIASGTCGENVRWKLDVDGTLTISGTGAMTDYDWEAPSPWTPYNHQIKAVVIRPGVTYVSEWVFEDCRMETVSLPDSVETVAWGAFSNCINLKEFTIPANLTEFEPYAFQNCDSLAAYRVDSRNPRFSVRDGVIFNADGTELLGYPAGAPNKEYTVPKGVKSLRDGAFRTSYLETLYLPASVEAGIENDGITYCRNLKNIYVDAANTVYASIDGVLFNKAMDTLLEYPIAHTLETFAVPYGTVRIARVAFEDARMQRVVIPQTVTRIDRYAFGWCRDLTEVFFLGSAPDFSKDYSYGGPNVFSDVTATAYYPAGDSSWTQQARASAGGNLTWIAKPLDELQSVYFEGLDMDAFAFEQEYLALRKGETAQVELTESFAALIGMVKWSVECSGTAPVSVDKTGKITALRAGTAEVVASITMDGETYTARCRVDVTDDAVSSEAFRNGITLVTDKVTTELYRTDYTRIAFAVNLTQNMTAFAEGAGENTGHAVRSARFYDSAAAQCFDLRVADDRTLEIIPTAYAIANPKAVKNVKSAILLDVDGSLFITSPLTLTVKKTLPTIKAKAVKINSFDSAPADLTFTGGNVLSVETTGYLPFGFYLYGMKLNYFGYDAKTSVKLNLLAEVEGLAVKRPVTVSVSVTRTEPTVKLSASSVTLLPGSRDKVTLTVNQSGPLDVAFYSDGYNVSNSIVWKLENGEFTIFAPGLSFAGKTLKCSVNVPGSSKKANLTVKVPAAAPTMTLKASGAVDMAIQGSPVTITPKFTGYHAGNGENYTVKILQSTTNADVSRLFSVNPNNGVLTITAAGSIPQGYTYTAYVTAVLDDSGMYRCEKSVKLPVKWSDPNKVPVSVTLKTKGSIDVIRPGTAVTITPAIKNWFGYTPSENDLVFYKNKLEITENVPFTVEIVDGCYVISNNGADSSAKYTVAFRALINRIPVTSKPISLPVKMASAKVTQDVKTVTLLKNDRYDAKTVELTAPEGTEIEKIGYSSDFFTVTPLGQNRYSISFRNSIPAPKSQTIKLSVFLKGNLTAKPNATLSVKVNLK